MSDIRNFLNEWTANVQTPLDVQVTLETKPLTSQNYSTVKAEFDQLGKDFTFEKFQEVVARLESQGIRVWPVNVENVSETDENKTCELTIEVTFTYGAQKETEAP